MNSLEEITRKFPFPFPYYPFHPIRILVIYRPSRSGHFHASAPSVHPLEAGEDTRHDVAKTERRGKDNRSNDVYTNPKREAFSGVQLYTRSA